MEDCQDCEFTMEIYGGPCEGCAERIEREDREDERDRHFEFQKGQGVA